MSMQNLLLKNNNKSALHIAYELSDLKTVQILVNAGADINAENKDKETPYMIAQIVAEKGIG